MQKKKNVFSEAPLKELHNQIQSSMVVKTLKPADDVYLKLSHIVYDIDEKNINIITGALMLT